MCASSWRLNVRCGLTIVVALFIATAEAPAQSIVREGQIKVTDHCSVDLDSGRSECMVVLDGDEGGRPGYPRIEGDDFRIERHGRALYLRPRHGASVVDQRHSLRIDELAVGARLRVRTSEGRLAQLTIVERAAKAAAVTFSYVVWDR